MSSRSTTKLFVTNIKDECRSSDLRTLFEKFGEVAECDIVKDYAFVHFYSADEAMAALEALDGAEFQGINLRVQLSHSRVRPKPGMGERETCYRCGKEGHWSKECTAGPGGKSGPPSRGAHRGGGHSDDHYPDHTGRDYYMPAAVGGPPDRYHPYDRRHGVPPGPGPTPRAPGYAHSEYGWPADYYSSRPGHPDYYSSANYGSVDYTSRREPTETDELGRPPPEYYRHRLKEAYYELVKDYKRDAPVYDESVRGQTYST